MKALVTIPLALFSLLCPTKGGEKERSCRIIFPQRSHEAPQEVHLFDGTASRIVPLPGMNFTEVIPLPDGDLVLSMTPDPVPKVGNMPKNAPQARIPAEMLDFYLVVLSDPENPVLPVRILPLDAGDERLKPGHTLWVNLTLHRIEGELGNSTLTILPNEHVVSAPPLATNGYFKAKFRFQPEAEGDFLPVMEKSWWYDAGSKNLGFIVDTPIGVPRIFTFRDLRPPSPNTQEAP